MAVPACHRDHIISDRSKLDRELLLVGVAQTKLAVAVAPSGPHSIIGSQEQGVVVSAERGDYVKLARRGCDLYTGAGGLFRHHHTTHNNTIREINHTPV